MMNTLMSVLMIDSNLVYRKLVIPRGKPFRSDYGAETVRYIFTKDGIIKEDSAGGRNAVNPKELFEESEFKDEFSDMDYNRQKGLFNEFVYKAAIPNKKYILIAMNDMRFDRRFQFKTFVDIYVRASEEEGVIEGVPKRIVSELFGRKLGPGKAVRIEKDLLLVTGERSVPNLYRKEETRAYFDKERGYYFRKSIITGAWQMESGNEYLRYNRQLLERYIDKDLFENTCMERLIPTSIEHKYSGENKVNYGAMLTQSQFLFAEQAAKVDCKLYEHVVDNIYAGKLKDGEKSLPEVLGITGSQIKFLAETSIPYDLPEFARLVNDRQFKEHYPDVKKRIFALSIFLPSQSSYYTHRKITKEELFEAVRTVNSIEKSDKDKRKKLCDEYLDYIIMRRQYMDYVETMELANKLYREITEFGDAPINIKPSRIKDAHDKLGRAVDIIRCADKINKYSESIRKRKEKEAEAKEFRGDKYTIVMPKDAEDIIREGQILEHCVGRAGYIDAMSRKECTILFLRSNENLSKPLITIEERDGAIRQCYGYRDSYNSDPEISAFIEEYAKEKNLKINTRY